MRILFLCRSLETGGAERQLVTLATGLHARGHDVRVAVFYPAGPLRGELTAAGVPVHDFGKRGRWDLASFTTSSLRWIRRADPEILHGYLVAPNLLATVARGLCPNVSIVWGVRASDMDLARYDPLSRVTFSLSVAMSRFADLLIANSEAGRRFHVASGFPPERFVVIPNGIDPERFRPDRALGAPLRALWGIRPEHRLVGLVGRADPMKDHETFLAAAEAASRADPALRFVCVGPDGISETDRLRALPTARRLGERLRWIGETGEMAPVYNALDLLALSSRSEGFPNVVAEAMACGVPCAVTDVGDAAVVVGKTGLVVAPGDPKALAGAVLRLLRESGSAPREDTRRRIEAHYSAEALCNRTEAALVTLRARRRP